jgi:hypothetical protein
MQKVIEEVLGMHPDERPWVSLKIQDMRQPLWGELISFDETSGEVTLIVQGANSPFFVNQKLSVYLGDIFAVGIDRE